MIDDLKLLAADVLDGGEAVPDLAPQQIVEHGQQILLRLLCDQINIQSTS